MLNHGSKNPSFYWRLVSFTFCVVTVFSLAACQSNPRVNLEETEYFSQLEELLEANNLGIGNRATNLVESQIMDWGHFNNQALIMAIDSNRLVLVTIKPPCQNLERARYIAFEPRAAFIIEDNIGAIQGIIREDFTEYLGRGDRLILAQSVEEMNFARMQQTGTSTPGLGDCTVEQFYYLEPIDREAESSS